MAGPVASGSGTSAAHLGGFDIPAKALPTEPMDLDETQEEGTGDTEMADAFAGPVKHDEEGNPIFPEVEQVRAEFSAQQKGKARAKPVIEKEGIMQGLQNVGNLKSLGDGMEGMGEQTWKGKGLTDPIKTIEVRSNITCI